MNHTILVLLLHSAHAKANVVDDRSLGRHDGFIQVSLSFVLPHNNETLCRAALTDPLPYYYTYWRNHIIFVLEP